MMERGIIKNFTITLDHSALGEPIAAFILATFLPNPKVSQRELAHSISDLDGVYDVHLIFGEYDMLVNVRGRSMEGIGTLVIDRICKADGVGRALTCASFAQIKVKGR